MVLTGANDTVAIVVSGTQTTPLAAAGVAVAYVVSDGANVIVQGTGTTTQLIQVL
jgi:hypothetical protein